MNDLESAGQPTDDQIPDLAPLTLRRLSEEIMDYADVDTGRGAALRRRPARRLVLAAAAIAATAIATVATVSSPPAEAAGWLAAPTATSGMSWASLVADCQQRMGTSADGVIVEQRGQSNFTVLDDTSMCLNATGPGIPYLLRTGGREVLPVADPAPNDVQVIHAELLGSVGPTGGQVTIGYTGAIGRVGADVTRIVIHTPEHPDVVASLDNGWFAAWWPSVDKASSMTVTTANGTRDQSMDLAMHWDPVNGWIG